MWQTKPCCQWRCLCTGPNSLLCKQVCVDETGRHELPKPPQPPHGTTTAMHAQLDAGADMMCTNIVETLHDCRECSKSFPCKVCLIGAIGKDGNENSGVHPLEESHLHIPATSTIDCVQVQCACSPHPARRSTLLGGDNIINSHPGLCWCDFTTMIVKHCNTGMFSLACQNNERLKDEFCVRGVVSAGNKPCSQPLIMPDLPACRQTQFV